MRHQLEAMIRQVVAEYARDLSVSIEEPLAFDVIISKDLSHGDFSCNVAFKLARYLKRSPKQVADELIPRLKQEASAGIQKLELGSGGFINFYLSRSSLADALNETRSQNERYGTSNFGQGKKVLIEFVSANPTGPLTIAHGRQAVVGDALVRILRAAGYVVSAEYYLNDAGRQMNLLGASLWARYCQEAGKEVDLPEDGYRGSYLIDLAARLFQERGQALLADPKAALQVCQQYARDQMMDSIRQDLETIGVKFDHYFSETTLYKNGEIERAFEDLKQRGHLYEEGGALWFRSTALGDDKDRVVRKSSGELTYLAPDIAYHRSKFERGYLRLIDLMGPDHHGYINRLKAACAALGHPPEEVHILIVQLTTLYRKGEPVRMSTRAGEFVTLKELVDEVGTDAARFFFIMRRVESHLDFDLDLAKQKSQENPVYYLQYAHARISGILRNAPHGIPPHARLELLNADEEMDLIKQIRSFPEIIIQSSQMLEPYRIADYLRDLAASFHKFYSCHRVISDDPDLTAARLVLVEATRIVLRNGSNLLGISQPESM